MQTDVQADQPKRDASVRGMNFDMHPDTLALRRLASGTRVWLDNGPDGAHLWHLHVADAAGRIVNLDGSQARGVALARDGDALQLDWQSVQDADTGAGPFDVRVTIAPCPAEETLTNWRLTVKNNSQSWTIWHVLFPQLNGLTPGQDPCSDRFFWPEMWGMQATGWDTMTDISGPCGGYGKHAMQFMGFTRGEHTLYLSAHDPEHWQKMMFFSPGKPADEPRRAALHFLATPSGMTEAGNSYEQAYDMVVGEVKGDWFDAAKVYAAFARRQPWANEPPTNASRATREEREVLVWEQASINKFPSDRVVTVNGKPVAEWVESMIKLRRKLGVRIAVHMYHWHRTPFDTDYPDYFPARSGFKELVADLGKGGVVVMPYINGRLWDQASPSYGPEAELAAEKISAKRVNPKTLYAWPESYGNGQLLTGMCMHTEYWRNIVVELCRRIIEELGCGGVYLDQLGCFGGRNCLDPRHGHPLGGGAYWLAGMRHLVSAIRDRIGPAPLLTTECNWEGCVADFDGLLDTQWDHETNIPIFPAVYWSQGAIFGGNLFAGAYADGGETFIQRTGMRFVWGGQFGWGHFEPLLKDGHEDLLTYCTDLCRLRTEYARFFRRGEFLRPPTVTLPSGEICHSPLKGPVLAAAWSDPDSPGRAALFLVNVTRQEQRVKVCSASAASFEAVLAPLASTMTPCTLTASPQ